LGISREKINAMMNVLNKRWLSQGWHVMNPKDSETMALVWIEVLDLNRIPFHHYETLYHRSVELRARRLAQGLKCDDFSVDMMVSCWPGLAQELHDKRVKTGRYLEPNAASDCEMCFGSGMRKKVNERNPQLSGFVPCDHGNQ
jgi:hypothetical protein